MHNKKSSMSKQSYYMHGKHAVIAALQNPKRVIEQVLCTESAFRQSKDLISKHKYEIINSDAMAKILGQNQIHQGICAQVLSIFSDSTDNLHSYAKIAILDQITDTQNIGAIIRSAAAFDIEAIIMPFDNMPFENAAIAKAASGALELVEVIKVTNLRSTIDFLKTIGFWVIGLDGHANDLLNKSMYSPKLAIALGSEEHGLRKLTKESCDYLVKIPTSEKVESLNVSVAAAIAFHWTIDLK